MKLAKSLSRVFLFAAAAAPAFAGDPAPPKVEELVVAPAAQNNVYLVSPKGCHLATVAQKGSRMIVIHDGVEGPKFDDIVTLDSGVKVLFSPDCSRHAYIGRSGDDYVLMVDGKEGMRPGSAKDGYGNSPVSQLTFTSNSKHLWFSLVVRKPASQGGGNYQSLVWDYVVEIPGGVAPVVSADGEHHAYTATNPNDGKQQSVVLDGKPAGYAGTDPQFTGDGKHLIVRTWVQQPDRTTALQLLFDGKPWVKAQEATIYPAPVGDVVASVVRRNGNDGPKAFLVIGGKKVEGSDTYAISSVTFSPDGKRYAAECQSAAGAHFMLVDGKRGQEYTYIANFAFSLDSSRCAYLAMMNQKTFIVVDGEESDGYLAAQDFTFGGGGKRMAYIAQAEPGMKTAVIDGAVASTKAINITELRFSADGAHLAYLMVANGAVHLILDGVENTELAHRQFQTLGGGSGMPPSIVLSRDGAHVAAFAAPASNQQALGLYVDGKPAYAGNSLLEPLFTPDGKHLVWGALEARAGRWHVFVDGVDCAQYTQGYLVPGNTRSWEMGEDGVLTVLAQDGDKMKRFRITPSPDTSVETLLANAANSAK